MSSIKTTIPKGHITQPGKMTIVEMGTKIQFITEMGKNVSGILIYHFSTNKT